MHSSTCWLICSASWLYAQYKLINRQSLLTAYTVHVDWHCLLINMYCCVCSQHVLPINQHVLCIQSTGTAYYSTWTVHTVNMHCRTCWLIDSACWLYAQYMLINRQYMLTVYTAVHVDTCTVLTVNKYWLLFNMYCAYSQQALPIIQHGLCILSTCTAY
jgi:hypothetical protein